MLGTSFVFEPSLGGKREVDTNDRKADVWTLPSCQRLHAAIGKARSESEEVEEEITTEGAAESSKSTAHKRPMGTEMGKSSTCPGEGNYQDIHRNHHVTLSLSGVSPFHLDCNGTKDTDGLRSG